MSKIRIVKSTTDGVEVLRIYSANQILCNVHLFEIGRGSFGTVLHTWHEIIGHHAAKCFTVTGGERQQSALEKKILKEYNKLQECQHKNVVIVFGITKWSGSMGILMEFCEGGNLKVLLLDDSIVLGPGLILRMNLDIASGVAFIHTCGLNKRVIHGDLKPENILLTAWLVCKITDFGSAQLASYTGSTTIDGRRERQAFTLFYAAPEKLRHGARPKKEQDTYSCGMIQHMTLTREDPYLSDHEFERKLELGLHPNCEAIQELKEESNESNREIVECIEGAMVRCWDHDPSNRPDMISIRDEFQELMAKQDHAVIAQQVADAVGGMNIQHPPQNPTVPLNQFSTEHRKFVVMASETPPQNISSNPDQHPPSNVQGGVRLFSSDFTNPKLAVDVRPQTNSPLGGDIEMGQQAQESQENQDVSGGSNEVVPQTPPSDGNLQTVTSTANLSHQDVRLQTHIPLDASAETPRQAPAAQLNQGGVRLFSSDFTNPKLAAQESQENQDANRSSTRDATPQTSSSHSSKRNVPEHRGLPSSGRNFRSVRDASHHTPPSDRNLMRDQAVAHSSNRQPAQPEFLVLGGKGSERDCVKWNLSTKQHQHLPKLNSARTASTSAKVGNTVYVMGGRGPTKSCEMMNLEEGERWTKFADLFEGRIYAASAVVGNEIYLSGGYGIHALSTTFIYSVLEERSRKGFDMSQRRYAHGMCSIGNVLFFVGGRDDRGKLLQSCEFHDIRVGTSTRIASLNEARGGSACVQIEGKIYAIGGWNRGRDLLQTVEKYEPRVNKWKYVSPLLNPRHLHSACVIDGRIYVVGGLRSVSDPLASVEVYEPTSDVWTHAFDLDKPVHNATVVAV